MSPTARHSFIRLVMNAYVRLRQEEKLFENLTNKDFQEE